MLTDEQLIKEYRKGNEVALRELVSRYLKPVYGFVYRYVHQAGDAEDITQDVFVNAWKNIKKFDEKRKFKTWIFTIARNASLNWIKKKKPALFSALENETGDSFVDLIPDGGMLPDEVFAKKDEFGKVSLALEKLDPRYAEVVKAHYGDGLNFREIADKNGSSINTIKSRHRRALMALKKLLGQ